MRKKEAKLYFRQTHINTSVCNDENHKSVLVLLTKTVFKLAIIELGEPPSTPSTSITSSVSE